LETTLVVKCQSLKLNISYLNHQNHSIFLFLSLSLTLILSFSAAPKSGIRLPGGRAKFYAPPTSLGGHSATHATPIIWEAKQCPTPDASVGKAVIRTGSPTNQDFPRIQRKARCST
jgi:hypothetical protein